jgi:drug/metabolite transporter (DMT)-like permease
LTPLTKARWQIHFCVVLWGFTAILGKLISLPAPALVWWRMSLVTVALLMMPKVWRGLSKLSLRLCAIYAGIGLVVALHWLTFYGAIKLANASVAATCMALGSVFAALIEPVVTRRRFEPRELALGVAVIPGVLLVAGGVPVGMRLGIVVGVVSAFLTALFGTLNKRYVDHADPFTVTCLELGAGALFLSLLLPWLPHAGATFPVPGRNDAIYLLLLALGCTLLPFTLALVALRHIRAFDAQIALNLEPVYAIVLAIVLLDEQRELTRLFYAGVGILLLAVFVQPWLIKTERAPSGID